MLDTTLDDEFRKLTRDEAMMNGGPLMTRVIHGIVHGQTIAVKEELGLAEGQQVELTIRAVAPPAGRQPGEGLLRTEGALADDTEWDAIMDELYQARKQERRPPAPDLGQP